VTGKLPGKGEGIQLWEPVLYAIIHMHKEHSRDTASLSAPTIPSNTDNIIPSTSFQVGWFQPISNVLRQIIPQDTWVPAASTIRNWFVLKGFGKARIHDKQRDKHCQSMWQPLLKSRYFTSTVNAMLTESKRNGNVISIFDYNKCSRAHNIIFPEHTVPEDIEPEDIVPEDIVLQLAALQAKVEKEMVALMNAEETRSWRTREFSLSDAMDFAHAADLLQRLCPFVWATHSAMVSVNKRNDFEVGQEILLDDHLTRAVVISILTLLSACSQRMFGGIKLNFTSFFWVASRGSR
jgi:hypothetical protein